MYTYISLVLFEEYGYKVLYGITIPVSSTVIRKEESNTGINSIVLLRQLPTISLF